MIEAVMRSEYTWSSVNNVFLDEVEEETEEEEFMEMEVEDGVQQISEDGDEATDAEEAVKTLAADIGNTVTGAEDVVAAADDSTPAENVERDEMSSGLQTGEEGFVISRQKKGRRSARGRS